MARVVTPVIQRGPTRGKDTAAARPTPPGLMRFTGSSPSKHQDIGSADIRTVRLGDTPWKNWAFYGRDGSRTR